MTVRTVHPAVAQGRVHVPPSKSYTHRALVAAFLARRPCQVVGPLDSDDTRATRNGLRSLGARVRVSGRNWIVSPVSGTLRTRHRTVRCGESGTTLRLLSAIAALGRDSIRLEGAPSLSSRPMEDLYAALRGLGARVHAPVDGHALPCTIQGPIRAGRVSIRGDISSQFTSALLMVLPTLAGRSTVRIVGPVVSEPYVEATRAVLNERRIRVRRTQGGFDIPGGQKYRYGAIRIPGDASSAAYLWAAAAATGGVVEVTGISATLPQADLEILRVLARMGARVHRSTRIVRVTGPLRRPIDADFTRAPDLFPLAAVLAALVPERRSRLHGAPHLEHKESDRRAESVRLARAVGATVSETPDSIEITGTLAPQPLDLPSLHDHRLVMSAAIASLAATGPSRIGEAGAVSKSFPDFWDTLGKVTGTEGRLP